MNKKVIVVTLITLAGAYFISDKSATLNIEIENPAIKTSAIKARTSKLVETSKNHKQDDSPTERVEMGQEKYLELESKWLDLDDELGKKTTKLKGLTKELAQNPSDSLEQEYEALKGEAIKLHQQYLEITSKYLAMTEDKMLRNYEEYQNEK